MRKTISTIFIVLVIVLILVASYFGFRIFEGDPPVITPVNVPEILGREGKITLKISDKGTGIRSIQAKAIQKDVTKEVFQKEYPMSNRLLGSDKKEDTIILNIQPAKLGLKPGEATFEISVHDASLRNGGKGNVAILKILVDIDYIPPMINVLSTAHNVRLGGCGAISFTVNEKVIRAGVRIDNNFFKAVKGEDGIFRTLFAIPFNLEHPKKVYVEAEDMAKNIGIGGFYYKILPLRKRKDKINISDSFLQKKMPEFASRFPEVASESLLETFLKVNSILRKKNNEFLLSLSKKSENKILWKGSFKRFAGATKSHFADERHYFYKGKEIDQSYHMGVDIASFAHANVPAANNGKVLFAGYNGIYGNTIVIDHGMGLLSLYAHLSQIMVAKDQMVQRGQIIGKTGTTGLAGGDHLHFGMILNGIFVTPVQWWDMRWIKEHITYNLALKK